MYQFDSEIDIPYVEQDGVTYCLDVHIPRDGRERRPVIIWVPIGGWETTYKENARTWLAEHGFALVSNNCRTSDEAKAPAVVHDCKTAVRWVRAHADEYGFDADRIGIAGASAGGHLAALLGLTGDDPRLEGAGGYNEYSSSVHAVCDVCGPSDLTRMAEPEARAANPVLHGLIEKFLGGPIEDHADMAKLLSPLTHVSPDAPPFLIIHGDADEAVPVEDSRKLHAALREKGVDSTLNILEGVGHQSPREAQEDAMVSFFSRTLG